MGAIVASLLQTLIKFVILLVVAWGGIVCGKKYRDSKDAKKAIETTSKNETR